MLRSKWQLTIRRCADSDTIMFSAELWMRYTFGSVHTNVLKSYFSTVYWDFFYPSLWNIWYGICLHQWWDGARGTTKRIWEYQRNMRYTACTTGQAFMPEIQYEQTEKFVLWTANQIDKSHLHHLKVWVMQGHVPQKYPWMMKPMDIVTYIKDTTNCMKNQYIYIYLWFRKFILPYTHYNLGTLLMCFTWVSPPTSFSFTLCLKIGHASLQRWKKWCHIQCRCHGKCKCPISASVISNKLTVVIQI